MFLVTVAVSACVVVGCVNNRVVTASGVVDVSCAVERRVVDSEAVGSTVEGPVVESGVASCAVEGCVTVDAVVLSD